MTIETTASSNFENEKRWDKNSFHFEHDPEQNHDNEYLNTEQSKHDRQFNQHIYLTNYDKFVEKTFSAYVKQHDSAKNVSKPYQWGSVKRFLRVDTQGRARPKSPDQELSTKVGAYDQYNQFLEQSIPVLTKSKGLTEEKARDLILKAVSNGLATYAKGFNERNSNIEMFESWIHVDEKGAPHTHSRVMPITIPPEKTKAGKIKKPSWSLNTAIRMEIEARPELVKRVKDTQAKIKAKNKKIKAENEKIKAINETLPEDEQLDLIEHDKTNPNQIRMGIWREMEDKEAMKCVNEAILEELPELGKDPAFKFVRKYEALNAPKLEVGRDHDEYVATKKALSTQKQELKDYADNAKTGILKIDKVRQQFEIKRDTAQAELENVQNQKKEAEKARDTAIKERKQAETSRDETISQQKKAEAKRNSAQSEYQNIQLSKQKAEDDRKNAISARDKAQNEQKDAESKRDKALKTLAEHQSELDDLNNYRNLVNEYKAQLENQKTTIARNSETLTQQQSKLDTLNDFDIKITNKKQELATTSTRVEDLKKTIDTNNSTIRTQNSQINENETKLTENRTKLAESETKIAENRKTLDDYTKNLDEKKKSILDKQNKEFKAQYEARKSSYKADLDKLDKSYQTKKEAYTEASKHYETQAKILPRFVSIYRQCAETFFKTVSDRNNEIFTFRNHAKEEPVLDSHGNTQTIAHAKATGVYKYEEMDFKGNLSIKKPTAFESIMNSFNNVSEKPHIFKAIKATAKKAFDLLKQPKNKQLLDNLDKLDADQVDKTILNRDLDPMSSFDDEKVPENTQEKARPELKILPKKTTQKEDEDTDNFDY